MAEAIVEMGEEFYSIVTPGGVGGPPVPYGTPACALEGEVLYYCFVDDPNEYEEDGKDAPPVYRVDATTVVASVINEVEDEESGGDGGDVIVDQEEDEEEEDEESGSGPQLVEEDEDENLD